MFLGKRIKELREEKQLLQRQLAAELEIDTPMFSKIERGERKAKREQVIELARLLEAFEALKEYKFALENLPARLVLHKSSNYNQDELDGFSDAIKDHSINSHDFIAIQETDIRFVREGMYPPQRGSMISLDEDRHILYTRGSIEYYRTYPGLYIPSPLEVRIVEGDVSPNIICQEILALTKMNWNNTQFDGKFPITIGCARKVGEIMKYLEISDKPQIRYAFYM